MRQFALDEEVEALVAAAARLAARELAPNARTAEAHGGWPERVRSVLSELSVPALDLPASLGGVGAGCLPKVAVLEALAAGDAGGLPGADQPGRAAGAVTACPDTALGAEVAGAGISGAAQSALVVGDPDAAGRPAALPWAPAWPPLRWVWVSAGDRLTLLAAPAPDEPTRVLGFGAAGGVSCTLDDGAATTIGEWRLPAGAGLAVRGRARLWAAAVAVGIAQAAFDATIAYTTERVVFGKPVAHHQGNAFELAAAATDVHGARLAVRDAAARFDRADPHAGFWATEAWVQAMDTAQHVTDLGVQLLGGHGFLVDHPAEKRFREARMLGLLAGGRDTADRDLSSWVLDVPDPVFP